MSAITINEHIHRAVAALEPETVFESKDLRIKKGKAACNSRKVSSILKGRIRCPENPKGDLRYENGTWMKLEAA
jgi:hypothetical protein